MAHNPDSWPVGGSDAVDYWTLKPEDFQADKPKPEPTIEHVTDGSVVRTTIEGPGGSVHIQERTIGGSAIMFADQFGKNEWEL